ncbi:hypothetical protein [Candidatus Protofrankia californiensis]|uniref:hypothetical protein n=1 Tax=Candidatus Protofrankia californiensis TaxID=1839754 RepID=UPI00104180B8|nr:hypothetical protein [Candidatus Protofrankia californiensis]
MNTVTTVLQALLGITILVLGVAGLHATLTRTAKAGTDSGGNDSAADASAANPRTNSPVSSRADSPANIAPLFLLTVTGLMVGSLLVAVVGLADNPLAYDLLFGAVAVALATFGRLRPATFLARIRDHLLREASRWKAAAWKTSAWKAGPRRAVLLTSVPILILAVAVGLSWWSDDTTMNAPVTALGATRTHTGLEVTVTRAEGDNGDLLLEVINAEGRQWRLPLEPRKKKVDVPVGSEATPAPTTVRLLVNGKIIRSITIQ